MASLGNLTLDLIARTGGYTGPIERAQNQSKRSFRRMERDAKSAAAGIAKTTAAAAAGAAALTAYAKVGMNNIDAQAKLAKRLDATIGELRGVELAASDAGIAQGKLESALESYNKRLGDAVSGTGEAQKAYKKLGLEAQAVADMPLPEQLALISEKISDLDTAAEKASVADRLMSGGRQMVNLFDEGGDAIRDAVDEVDSFGLAISDVDAAAVEDANDAISRLGLVSESAQDAVAINLAPALEELAETLMDVTQAFHDGEYDTQIKVFKSVATVVAGATAAYTTYKSAVRLATIAQWAFNAAVRANPLVRLATIAGTVVGALGALGSTMDDSSERAKRLEKRSDDLAASLKKMGETSLRVELAALTVELSRMEGAQEALQEQSQENVRTHSALGANMGSLTETIDKTTKANRHSTEEMENMQVRVGGLQKAIKMLDEETDDAENTVNDYSVSTSEAAKQTIKASRAAEDLLSSYRSLEDELFPIEAQQERLRQKQLLLQQAFTTGVIGIDRYLEAWQRLQDAQMSGQSASEAYGGDGGFGAELGMGGMGQGDDQSQWDRWLEAAEGAFTDFDEMAANTAQSFQRGFGNAFESMIFDSQSFGDSMYNLFDGIARTLVSTLGEMAAQWVAYQAVQLLVGKTTQASAATTQAANASAMSVMAGLNAFAATAAIPIVGPVAAPAAAAAALTATAPMAATVAALSSAGMAHDGIDSVPADGTWNLQKGERVTTAETSAKLDRTLDDVRRGRSGDNGGNVTVNLIEDKRRAGQTKEREGADQQKQIDVFVADIMGDGPRSQAVRNKFGLTPQGR